MLPARKPNSAYWLHFATLGLYFFYWAARSGGEVNRALGKREVPSAWWFLVPFYGLYWWMWQYGRALETLSDRRIKSGDTFLLYLIITNIWLIGPAINLQDTGASDGIVLTVFFVSFGVFWLVQILSHAFFCAVTQKKINTLLAMQVPTNPAQPTPDLQKQG